MVSKAHMIKMMILEQESYRTASALYERLENREPLAFERSNLQIMVDLLAMKTGIFLHMRTIEALMEALDQINYLRAELDAEKARG